MSTTEMTSGEGDLLSKAEIIKPGTLLLKCEPLAYVGRLAPPIILCDNCLIMEVALDYKLKRCASCQVVYYCNAACQKKGWNSGHRYECKQMKQLVASPLAESKLAWMPRLVVRLIVKLQDGKDYYDELDIGGTKVKRRFQDLLSNCDIIKGNEDQMLPICMVIQTAKAMLQPFSSKIKIPDDNELFQICGKIQTNSHVIGNYGFDIVGTGLYLGFSIFNHSCKSMANNVFEGPTMIVRSTVEIPKSLPLDKVTVCYINSLVPTDERRKELEDIWYFHCKCELCQTGELDREMRGIICSNKGCNAEIDTKEIRKPCSACGHVMGEDMIAKVLEAEYHARKEVEVEDPNPGSIEAGIKRLKALHFSEKHWIMLKLLGRANDWTIAMAKMTRMDEFWRKAYEYGSRYLLGLRRFSERNDTEILRILLDLTFSSTVLNKLDEAEKFISEARSISEVIFGKDSEFIRIRIDPAQMHLQRKRGRMISDPSA